MAFIPLEEAAARRTPPAGRFALFAYGFRPFFLLCGLYGAAALSLWLFVLLRGAPFEGPWGPVRWHMHEMLFGFAGAAIGGFLLTAVPSWTGGRGHSGRPLMLLTALWLAGRLAVNPLAPLPPLAAAALDLAFFPALAATVLPSLLRSGNRRNYPFLGMLALLTGGNMLCHLETAFPGTWEHGVALTVDTILLMVVMVGGRIVPAFTGNALRRVGVMAELAPRPWLERAALGSVLLMLVADQAAPESALAGAASLLAAGVTLARLAGWQGWRTLGQPILAVLHLGYAWIPVGLALKAAWLLASMPIAAAWQHAITLGAFGTMILAVMSRAALGHTGRDIVASPLTVAAYALLTVAVVARVFGTAVAYHPALVVAGFGWIAAFALFTVTYAPILARPRADGRPG
ncbi:MAG TPA: NnrS family protein [Azospirillaceae bacterium]|nr:NnrS family protein [Azospirillaceae bacterium]